MHPSLDIHNLRSLLIRQEETIIFALVERAQFKRNEVIYRADGIAIPDFQGSFVDYLLHGTEALHATVRRYTSPDEHPFFDNLPDPILSPLDYEEPIKETSININDRVKRTYEDEIIPAICAPGDDEQYGSSAVCDVACLQALSKRIHYGEFIAESKFLSDRDAYLPLIQARDREAIREKITNRAVEKKLLKRVAQKAATYAQEIEAADSEAETRISELEIRNSKKENPKYEIRNQESKTFPRLVVDIYEKWLIPLTKDVEVEYLLLRGD